MVNLFSPSPPKSFLKGKSDYVTAQSICFPPPRQRMEVQAWHTRLPKVTSAVTLYLGYFNDVDFATQGLHIKKANSLNIK